MKNVGAISILCLAIMAVACTTPGPEGPIDLLGDPGAGEVEQEKNARQACEKGEVEGCRELAHIHTLGLSGEFDFKLGAALFRWGCEVADDGESCHSLGELHRLGVGDAKEERASQRYFRRACELGEMAGCHDAAVQVLRREDIGEEQEQHAAEEFEKACSSGLAAGCTNLAYMKASGRGTAREHGQALGLFLSACDEPGQWQPDRLAPLSEIGESEVYAVAEYEPRRACEQLEVLAKGSFEERIISAMDAEAESLGECYDEARDESEESVGRLIFEADVSADGGGGAPEVVDDSLELAQVRECAQTAMSRHLDDGSGAGTPRFRARWGISFIHAPIRAQTDSPPACDGQAVRKALGEISEELQSCGRHYLDRPGSSAGALILWWNFAPAGEVVEVAMTTTINDRRLLECMDATLHKLSIPSFEGGSCPVQVPLLFRGGEILHFSVIGR